jgi:dihydroorotate dehydrogenase (fumarate)
MTVIPETRAASAVVLPLLFEEQLVLEKQARFAHLEAHKEGFAEALSFLPAVDDFDKSSGEYLRLIQDAKRAVSIPIIASLNGIWPGGWVTHARMLR